MDTNTLAKPAKRYGLTVGAYALDFSHETHPDAKNGGGWPKSVMIRGKKREVLCTRRTIARLIQLSTSGVHAEDVVAEGEAYCSPSDTPDREIGRQVALSELLKALPKERGKDKQHLGRKLLDAYLSRPGALPWVMTPDGHVDYAFLADARSRRMIRREMDHLLGQLVRVDEYLAAQDRGRKQALEMAKALGFSAVPLAPMEPTRH